MHYPYVCKSPSALMRRLVFDYLRHGYYRLSSFEVPAKKGGAEELARIDQKIINDYSITYDRVRRMRGRRRGEASIVHLRYDRWIVLVATDGTHVQEGRINWHDLRREPLTLWGYSIRVTPTGSPVVKVADQKWSRIRRTAHAIALHNESKVSFFFRTWLERAVPFNHPGVMHQKMKLRNEINYQRGAAGLPKIQRSTREQIKDELRAALSVR